MALHLPELHRLAPQVVVQLHCEDGRCSALILRTLLACRKETFNIKLRRCDHEAPHSSVRNIFHRSDSADSVGPLSHSVFREYRRAATAACVFLQNQQQVFHGVFLLCNSFYFLCKMCRELAWSFACLDWSLLVWAHSTD